MPVHRVFCALLIAAALTPSISAHDMWLVPPTGPLTAGSPVEVSVSVGMDFPQSLSAVDPAALTIVAYGPGEATADIELSKAEDENRTVARLVPSVPGTWIVSAQTQPKRIELSAADFNSYLLHDGLGHVLAQRFHDGELDQGAVERYSKYTKALFAVDDAGWENAAQLAVGLKLEILLLNDPLQSRPGEVLQAQVLLDGKPLAEANLCWDHPGDGERFSGQTWTDEEGKALVPIAKPGLMTLRLIHMTRPQHQDYQWESFWASYTFRIPAE